MEKDIWQEIEELYQEFQKLGISQSQDDETNQPFLDFMATQLRKSLSLEIERYNISHKRGFSFMF